MSILLFTLTAANLCTYFAFASLFSCFAEIIPAVFAAQLLGPAACALGCLAAEKKPALRFVFVLLPPLSLLLTREIPQMLLLAFAVVYPILILISGRFSVDYWQYRNHILVSGFVLLVLTVFTQVDKVRLYPLGFGIAGLVLGVFTLRQLRFGRVTGPKQRALELLSLCAPPAALLALVLIAYTLKDAAAWVAKSVIYPLGVGMQKVVGFFDSLITPVTDVPPEREESSRLFESAVEVEEAPPVTDGLPPARESSGDLVAVLLIVAAAAIVFWLIYRFGRYLKETRTDKTLEERADLETEPDYGETIAGAAAQKRSNRRKMRQIYEKYLKMLSRRHYYRKPTDTSRDVLEKTREITPEEPARALRALYIPARYDPNAVVTGEQLRAGRQLLRKLREEPKADSKEAPASQTETKS